MNATSTQAAATTGSRDGTVRRDRPGPNRLPRPRLRRADPLRPWPARRRASLGRCRRTPGAEPSLPRRRLADGLAQDRDEPGGRPLAPGHGRGDRRLSRRARARAGDARRQRQRRRDLADADRGASRARRAPDPHQLRHVREVPAVSVQPDAADRAHPGRHGAAGGAVSHRRPPSRDLLAARQARDPARARRRLARRRRCAFPG